VLEQQECVRAEGLLEGLPGLDLHALRVLAGATRGRLPDVATVVPDPSKA
jgi:hypothetical protein